MGLRPKLQRVFSSEFIESPPTEKKSITWTPFGAEEMVKIRFSQEVAFYDEFKQQLRMDS
jgi:hypothetical protein